MEYDCFKEGFDNIAGLKDDMKGFMGNFMNVMMEQLQSNTCLFNITNPEVESNPNEGNYLCFDVVNLIRNINRSSNGWRIPRWQSCTVRTY